VVVKDPHLSPPGAPTTVPPRAVVWHDLECGGYRADLPLWRELAGSSRGAGTSDPILDVGAGTGRVALELARAGHRLTALDLDGELLEALSGRAPSAEIEVVRGDARTFELGRGDFGLCLAPMQTVQLLDGPDGRLAFLRRAQAHLRPGGLLACAIVTDFEPFDCADGEGGPDAESVRLEGDLYVSRALRVSLEEHRVVIERERRVLPGTPPWTGMAALGRHRTGGRAGDVERNVIVLDRVSVEQLESEALEAGLRPAPARSIAATAEHLGSVVVMLHA
jgi:SAM-dependent methyltransferase